MPQFALVDVTDDTVLAEGVSVISVSDARALVERLAQVTTSRDVERFCDGFTDDCVVRFNCGPEVVGREALRKFMTAGFRFYPAPYRCDKRLRSISGNFLGVEYVNTWRDVASGEQKIGRGSEFWIMRAARIARWDAVFALG